MASKQETTLSKEVQQHVTNNGGYVLKLHGGVFQRAGEPDLIGGLYQVPFAVELKVGDSEPTPLQLYRLECWRRAGFLTGVVYSLDEFKELFL